VRVLPGEATIEHQYVIGSLAQIATREDRVCVLNILGGESSEVTPVGHAYSGGNGFAGVDRTALAARVSSRHRGSPSARRLDPAVARTGGIATYLRLAGWGTTTLISSGKDVYIQYAAPEFAFALANACW
jgi:hypothetical protein